jgi:prepilin-type N-terminal cleavage/methylation domain-containing protein
MRKVEKVPMNVTQKEKGFTIIEVVLVLAIAGLIFLMVFIALPALQRSQRDTQRRTDVSRVLTQVTSYTNNNRGSIPATMSTSGPGGKSFVQNYLGGATANTAGNDYQDPTTGSYIFVDGVAPTQGQIAYYAKAKCDVDGATIVGTARQFALTISLESQSTPYCVDNH